MRVNTLRWQLFAGTFSVILAQNEFASTKLILQFVHGNGTGLTNSK
jgi:hypothetical protein